MFCPLNEDIRILERDLVVYTLLLKTEVTMKTGVNVTFEKLAVTGICKKVDNQWKTIFYQESGLPPTVIK